MKDYGLIAQLDDCEDGLTGFIVNEQKASVDKTYKAGKTSLDCIVLDIDNEKRIVDLSERLFTVEEESKVSKKSKDAIWGGYQKAVVELNKEKYLVVTLKSDRTRVAVCLL